MLPCVLRKADTKCNHESDIYELCRGTTARVDDSHTADASSAPSGQTDSYHLVHKGSESNTQERPAKQTRA